MRGLLCQVPGVLSVRDLHVWALKPGMPLLATHLNIEGASPEACSPGLRASCTVTCAYAMREGWCRASAFGPGSALPFRLCPCLLGPSDHAGVRMTGKAGACTALTAACHAVCSGERCVRGARARDRVLPLAGHQPHHHPAAARPGGLLHRVAAAALELRQLLAIACARVCGSMVCHCSSQQVLSFHICHVRGHLTVCQNCSYLRLFCQKNLPVRAALRMRPAAWQRHMCSGHLTANQVI